MKKKILRSLWLIIILLFVAMEIYHIAVGNYDDLVTSLLTVIALLSMTGVYFLLTNQSKK